MNIAFIIPSMLSGGAERVISVLCNEFVEKENNVWLLLTENATDIAYPLDKRVQIVDLVDTRKPFIKRVPSYVKTIKNALKHNSIEIVVSFIVRTNILAIMAGKLLGIPVVISERNNPYIIPDNPTWRYIRDFAYRFADGIVFQTKYAQQYFCKAIRNKSCVIMNPISTSVLSVPPEVKRENVIVSVGRLVEQKNIPMLIDAVFLIKDIIRDYKVIVWGEGEMRRDLQDRIDSKGMHEIILLKGHSSEVIQEVAKSRVFVMTSRFEGLSNAVMEAMCVGTPCVVTDSPTYGNRDLIEDGISGFLVPLNDTKQLAERLLALVQDELLWDRISLQSKKLYSKVNSKVIYAKWQAVIENVLK